MDTIGQCFFQPIKRLDRVTVPQSMGLIFLLYHIPCNRPGQINEGRDEEATLHLTNRYLTKGGTSHQDNGCKVQSGISDQISVDGKLKRSCHGQAKTTSQTRFL